MKRGALLGFGVGIAAVALIWGFVDPMAAAWLLGMAGLPTIIGVWALHDLLPMLAPMEWDAVGVVINWTLLGLVAGWLRPRLRRS